MDEERHADPYGYTDCDPDGNTHGNTHAYGYTDGNPDGHAYGNPDSDTHGCADAHTGADRPAAAHA